MKPNPATKHRNGTSASGAGSIFFDYKERDTNHVNLIGSMTSKPRFYELPNGKRVAQFTLCTKDFYLDKDGNTKSKSSWHRIAAWGRWVQVLEELSETGMKLAIEGKLSTRFYYRDGMRQFISEVEVNDLIIL